MSSEAEGTVQPESVVTEAEQNPSNTTESPANTETQGENTDSKAEQNEPTQQGESAPVIDPLHRDEYALLLNKGVIQSIQPQLTALEEQLLSINEAQKGLIQSIRLDHSELDINLQSLAEVLHVFSATTEYVGRIHNMQDRMRSITDKVEKLQKRTEALQIKKQELESNESARKQREEEKEQSLNAKVASYLHMPGGKKN